MCCGPVSGSGGTGCWSSGYAPTSQRQGWGRGPAASGRALAERHGVSRAFIKQAILALEVQGLVDVRQSGGTHLRRDDITVEPIDALMACRRRCPSTGDP